MRISFQSHQEAKPASRNGAQTTPVTHSARLKAVGIAFRSLLLLVLFLMAARVSAPQHLGRTWYDIPLGDMIRGALGIAFCVWMLVELFILPKDPASYRTWMYLGVTLLPLGVVCLIVVW
jgi:hypothetical protein